MMDKKYKVILTVLSIIAVVAIISLIIFIVVDNANTKKQKEEQASAVAEFIRDYGNEDNTDNNNNNDNDDEDERPDEGISQVPEIIEGFNNSTNSGGQNSSSNGYSNNGKTYKGFNMVGYIKIPKTGIELPILDVVTKKSLEASVAILYPSNAVLNESPNVVIAGHNYRNSSFFSNNKKLQEGDKIYIGDTKGRQVVYTVYSNFEAAPEDTSFYTRDTGYKEITLTTCTQDSQKRTIILARAE